MSGKQARRRRKQAGSPPPVQRKGERRRASPKVLVGAAVTGIVLAGIAVGIALPFGGKSSDTGTSVPSRGSTTNAAALPFAADAAHEFAGIPQHGMFLGSPKAPVTLVEYIDLQCPICREFEVALMPTIVQRYVRTGKVRVEARPLAFIGPDSVPAREAAIAAARQNRAYPFMQVIYLNQGTENTGWLDKNFLEHAAAGVPGLEVPALLTQMKSAAVSDQARSFDNEATADKVPGTPALYVGKRGEKPRAVPASGLLSAIQRALR